MTDPKPVEEARAMAEHFPEDRLGTRMGAEVFDDDLPWPSKRRRKPPHPLLWVAGGGRIAPRTDA
jgi:hypothetical protein